MAVTQNDFRTSQPTPNQGSPAVPVVASNRSNNLAKQFFNSQIAGDPIAQALENATPLERGSRKQPSLLKFPNNIGTGEVPHVMQFKVFWRFEPRDLKESLMNAKKENERVIGDLNTLHSLIESGGNLTDNAIQKSGLDGEKIQALKALQSDTNLLKLVDPRINSSLDQILALNPGKAKQVLEQTITSYQSRLTDITTELDNGVGKIGKDEQERSLVLSRFSDKIESTGVGDAAVSYGGLGAILGGVAGFFLGGGKGAALGALAGGAGGAAAGAAGVGLAKAFNNDAVYDQMVSIYLPFCTKINNEDTFQYEETDQAILQGVGDFASAPLDTTRQAAYVAAEKGAKGLGVGGAVGAGAGKITNPRLEKLFKQKDFRNFSFSWEIYPRSREETEAIRNIIETFRYHAHPARDSDTENKEDDKAEVILRVPGEFEIKFLSTNPNPNQGGFVENEFFPKIARCALNSISVDFTPNSVFSSFENNSPTAVTFTLQFSEMGLITREDVSKGF
jgi:hypothetical protein